MSKAAELAALIGSQTALSNRNLIINGAMQVAQRGTSATVSDNSNEGYSTLDRWFLNFNNGVGGGVTFSQSTDTPNGFANSLKIQCSSTDSVGSTNEYVAVRQVIEAQNLQMLGYGTSAAKSMTLSWQMKADNYTGPISVQFKTADGTAEYYVKSYTPTSSWATYTCTVPGSTSATINDDNGEGMRVQFTLAGHTGSSIAASSDSTAWSTTRADYRDDIGNLLSNTSNAIYITGVQLEVGEQATPFEHRSFGDELQRCKRYFQKNNVAFFTLSVARKTDNLKRGTLQYSTMRDDPAYTAIDDSPDSATINVQDTQPEGLELRMSGGADTNVPLVKIYSVDAEL
tara:strand:+ start:1063 stop:2091 length:1029 start_codon:yes stop_codon:yes gene_type:complete